MRYNILPLRRHPTLLALAFDCHCINTCWVSVHSAVFEFIFKIIFDCRDMTWNNFQNCAVVCLYKKGRRISLMLERNGILLPKLFWPTMRKNCSSDRENLLKSFYCNTKGFSRKNFLLCHKKTRKEGKKIRRK